MGPRHRFRRWRYRRWFARHSGYPPEEARAMASICASLDVPPKLVMSMAPHTNHWSAWNTGEPPPPGTICPSAAAVERELDNG